MELVVRHVYVRLECSTRGHVLVVILAHRLVQELQQQCWASENLTVEEGIRELSMCVTQAIVNGTVRDQLVAEGRAQVKRLLELAKVQMPKKLHYTGKPAATRKQLKEFKPQRCK